MELNHFDSSGQARIVDISSKQIVKRTASARAIVALQEHTINTVKQGLLKKGDCIACSRIAGIMAAKKTSELIPLCHNIEITHVTIDFTINTHSITIDSQVCATAKTGVEMEALTAVSVAALTMIDMCKSIDKQIVIQSIHVTNKTKVSLS